MSHNRVFVTVRDGRKVVQKITVKLDILSKYLSGKDTNTFNINDSIERLKQGYTYRYKDLSRGVTLSPILDAIY